MIVPSSKTLVFEGGEAVGEAADADTLDVAGVVAGATRVVVTALGDTVVGEDAQERRLRPVREHLLEDEVAAVLDVDEVPHLCDATRRRPRRRR